MLLSRPSSQQRWPYRARLDDLKVLSL
jgi:hypothetical protein